MNPKRNRKSQYPNETLIARSAASFRGFISDSFEICESNRSNNHLQFIDLLAQIYHRFLLNGYNWLDNKEW